MSEEQTDKQEIEELKRKMSGVLRRIEYLEEEVRRNNLNNAVRRGTSFMPQ